MQRKQKQTQTPSSNTQPSVQSKDIAQPEKKWLTDPVLHKRGNEWCSWKDDLDRGLKMMSEFAKKY